MQWSNINEMKSIIIIKYKNVINCKNIMKLY